MAELLQRSASLCASEIDGLSKDELVLALQNESECTTGLATFLQEIPKATSTEHGIDATTIRLLCTLAHRNAELAEEVEQAMVSIADLSALAQAQKSVQDYDAALAANDLPLAAQIISELSFSTPPETIRKAVDERAHGLRDYIASLPFYYIVVDRNTCMPSLRPPLEASRASLARVWEAAAILDIFDQALVGLAAFIVQHCIAPICSVEGTPHGVMERAMYKVLKATVDTTLDCAGSSRLTPRELRSRFGAVFWPVASERYIESKLRPLLSTIDRSSTTDRMESGIDELLRTGQLGVKLEDKAMKLGLLGDQREGPIGQFVRQALMNYTDQQRSKRLWYAREALSKCYSMASPSPAAEEELVLVTSFSRHFLCADRKGSTVISNERCHDLSPPSSIEATVGENRTRLERSEIEDAVRELANELPLWEPGGRYSMRSGVASVADILMSTVKEASESKHSVVVESLLRTVIDMAALVVALDPSSMGETNKRQLPYFVALRYNECMHVYRCLCMIPMMYAGLLENRSRFSAELLDVAQRVRAAGEDSLDSMIAREGAALLEEAKEVTGWSSKMDGKSALRARKAAHGLRASFNRLCAILRDVLMPMGFVRVWSSLLNTVCGRLADSILELSDISEEDSTEIPKLLEPLLEDNVGKGVGLTVPRSTSGPNTDHGDKVCDEHGDAIPVALMPSEWMRLKEITELLDIPSREIARRWQSGKLTEAGLSKDQVQHLVRALFEDTPHRRETLDIIGNNA